jgi:disulfide bond formation protein DsbB
MAAAMVGALLAGLFGTRSRKLRRLVCVLGLVALGGFATGCSEPAPLLTPKGSYALTLVGTDSDATPNITASTTFTVVVE